MCPGCTVNDIADALGLTPRSVWNNVRTLRRSGAVRANSTGRTNKLYVNLDAPLRLPVMSGLTLRPLMSQIVEEARLRPHEICRRTRRRAERD
jgi:hypothetical protein